MINEFRFSTYENWKWEMEWNLRWDIEKWEILNKDMAINYECQVADISPLFLLKARNTRYI